MYEISDWEIRKIATDRMEDSVREAEQDQFALAYSKPGQSSLGPWVAALVLAVSVAVTVMWQLAG